MTAQNHAASADLAERFETHRPLLRTVGYRMLGSLAEAEDAVQEAWFRLSRTEETEIANLAGWLTTVVGRICLDQLRTRAARREDLLGVHVPDPVLTPVPDPSLTTQPEGPEQRALLDDELGLALMVVLDTLAPAERLAFVLHDMFAVPFEEIAAVAGRSGAATRQSAARARRRVRAAAPPAPDLGRQRAAVQAFQTAAREGDFDALLAVLDPDVLLRADYGALTPGANRELHGAETVAANALTFARFAAESRLVLVNGTYGFAAAPGGRLFSVLAFTVVEDRITRIDVLADQARLAALDTTFLLQP
ncbi:RNA polymerase sigma 70 [Kitasatospora sp. MMS16-BH015]|uniref:sigma-70 family RNA polymerase sigma factor n=1 Tax=Kitasatospora sp. MMS16-BH015 TaxID=2018025 RepID=UPI000CA2AAD0|nr:sigma-70 family RNA polymerase sigma factor [Kitasatospora sp. MMS16-BH015]AUG79208.1 RNA polymerase sigma 70 [Kitasatospora sp. MMS16-BH015]